MGNTCAKIILDAAGNNNKLRYLNMSKNEMTDTISQSLKNFLTDNAGIVTFFIAWNKFTAKGAIDIA